MILPASKPRASRRSYTKPFAWLATEGGYPGRGDHAALAQLLPGLTPSESTAPVGSTDEWQNGPDSGIARVEAAPCHRAQKQGNDFGRRPQFTNADMGADGTSQKARH
jgi:hypothetical protein